MEFHPKKFAAAVKELAEDDKSPYLHVAKARRHMEEATLHSLAFGLVGSAFVKGDYDASQTFLTKNLKTGTENFATMLGDMNNITKIYHKAEQANVIDGSKLPEPKIQPTDNNSDIIFGAGAMSSAWFLGVAALIGEPIMAGCAGLAVSAGVAAALWACFIPDDTALSQAHGRWQAATRELENFDANMPVIMKKFTEAWPESKAADAFAKYIQRFTSEIDECKAAVTSGAHALQKIHEELNYQQWFWITSALICLTVLIFCQIAQVAFPPSAGFWRYVAEATGALMALGVLKFVNFVFKVLQDVFGGTSVLAGSTFVTKKQKSDDGNGVDFAEVDPFRLTIQRNGDVAVTGI